MTNYGAVLYACKRSAQLLRPASLIVDGLAVANGEVRETLDQSHRAITPGQAVVFYDSDLVIGGGWIAEALKT